MTPRLAWHFLAFDGDAQPVVVEFWSIATGAVPQRHPGLNKCRMQDISAGQVSTSFS